VTSTVVSKVIEWREAALDPYLDEYEDPVVIVTVKLPGRSRIFADGGVPKWSKELLDNDGHLWSLTSREDAVVFKLLGSVRVVSVMEVNEFLEMMTSYATAKGLWTGIDYDRQVRGMIDEGKC